jgi:protein-arginine kinase activator protein McsA
MRAEMGKMLKTEDAHQDAADTVDEEAVEVTDAEIEQDIRFKLMEAVIREDFEEAARLRDLLAPYDHQEEKA